MAIGWFVAALILGIAELLSVDLFFLTLALASVAGGVGALLGLSIPLQILVFALASLLLLIFIRPWAKRQLQRSTPDIDTGARGLVGKTAVVTNALLGPAGRVRLEGSEWSARGQDGRVFQAGTEVRVVAIDGATAVVGPLEEQVQVPPDSEPPEPA